MMVSDYMIGKVDIPVRSLVIDELPHTFPMTFKVFSPAVVVVSSNSNISSSCSSSSNSSSSSSSGNSSSSKQ